MRFTTDENEDCRDIAVRVREIGECQPIYEDDTDDEFMAALNLIDTARREMPREAKNQYMRVYNHNHKLKVVNK
jgi:hypothetical protein